MKGPQAVVVVNIIGESYGTNVEGSLGYNTCSGTINYLGVVQATVSVSSNGDCRP